MTRHDLDPHLLAWFDAGPLAMPDRVLDAVAERIERQPQRPGRTWRLRGRHFMDRNAKVAAGLAAVLVIGFAGWQLLPGRAGTGAPPTPQPSPSAEASVSPTAAAWRGRIQGDTRSFTAALPTGWAPAAAAWYATKRQGVGAPAGIAVAVSGAVNVPTDPCDGVGKASTATSADAVVADLRARKDLTVSAATAASVGGLSGVRVQLQVADPSPCADSYIIFAEPDGSGIHAQGPSYRQSLWILDTKTGPIWVAIGSFPGTSAADIAEAEAVVASITFVP